MISRRTRLLTRACVSLLVVIAVTAGCFWLGVNATTTALVMLLCVLAVATRWGLADAVVTSVVAVFSFNYFFLPPVGTFTVADPQNWVALFTFLVTAVTASKLSTQVQERANEALLRRQESERLYAFSRSLLTEDSSEVQFGLREASRIFNLRRIAYYDRTRDEVRGCPASSEVEIRLRTTLVRVSESEEPSVEGSTVVVPVRLGRAAMGSLAIEGGDLTSEVRDAIASLIAINQERIQALDRAAAAEAARRNEQLKSTLLDSLAHDLNTPLSAIKTSVTTLLTHQLRTEASRDELLCIIDEETDRLHRVIGEALMLARVESRKVNLERASHEAAEIVLRAVEGSRVDPERIVTDIREPFRVTVDGELLALALKQLIENAARYSPPNAPIYLSAHIDAPVATFSVRDHGEGIRLNERERIFDKYQRGALGKGTKEGTGMGLAIAKAIVEAHGGRIWAENAIGGGALFTVLITNTKECQ